MSGLLAPADPAGWLRIDPQAQLHACAASQAEAAALRRALAQAGQPFRLGGGDAPVTAGLGHFETLTAGSSGTARRILRSMASWSASFKVNATLFGIGVGVPVVVLGRLEHSLSLYGALEGLYLGATVHLLGGLRPDRQGAAVPEGAVIYATPAQLRQLVAAGLQRLAARVILVGGSKLDARLRADLAALAPYATVREFYGAAEASFITLADHDTPPESVGRPYPAVEIALRDAQGADVAQGLGQIWVRSPYLFQGYAGPDQGGALWRDGWLSVAEVGRMAGGYLYLAGRAGRMVTVADQNVFPEELEAIIATYAGVEQVAIVPMPDALRGVVLCAVLLGDPSQEGAILTAARARFGALKAPRRVIWRTDWPVLPSGKTDFARLQREAGL